MPPIRQPKLLQSLNTPDTLLVRVTRGTRLNVHTEVQEYRNKMKSMRMVLSSALLVATALPASANTHAHRGPTSPNLFKRRSASKMGVHTTSKPTGPRAIDSERATQIQAALIRSGYLTGTPSGHWDSESEAAMQKLQGDRGWQTKLTPDSRALILLGLGPNSGPNNSASGGQASALTEAPFSQVQGQPSALSSGTPLESTFASQ